MSTKGTKSEHKIVSREEWIAARKQLLEAEKELTRRSDEVAKKRQELPWFGWKRIIDSRLMRAVSRGRTLRREAVSFLRISLGKLMIRFWETAFGSDFNFDFNTSFTPEQQREGIEYNY